VVQFQTYQLQSGFDQKVLIEAFKRNMNKQILETIYRREILPATLLEWQTAAINIDRRRAELQQFTGGGYRSQNTQQRLAGQTQYYRPNTANPAQPKDPNAMDVNRTCTRGGNRTCYNCGKEGHFKAQCPKPCKPRQARATEMTNEENNEYVRTTQEEMKRRGISIIGLPLLSNDTLGFVMDGQ